MEHPIFVPFDGGHLAAVITVPESRPRSLVLLLQGLGAPRSHRYGLWTRTARALAERGLASVRFDYPEMGDSTGTLHGDLEKPPVAEANAVAETALAVLGLDRFGVVGNCLGARTASVLAAATDRCVSVVFLGQPNSLLINEGRTAPLRAARRWSKRAPRAARMVRSMVVSRPGPRYRFVGDLENALTTTDVLFVLLEQDRDVRMEQRLQAIRPPRGTCRLEVATIEAEGGTILQIPLHSQGVVIDALVQWMDQTLPQGPGTSETLPASAATPGA